MDISLHSPASDSKLVYKKHKFDITVGWVCLWWITYFHSLPGNTCWYNSVDTTLACHLVPVRLLLYWIKPFGLAILGMASFFWYQLLTKLEGLLYMKAKLYNSCVRSAMLYGSETWGVKNDDVKKFTVLKKECWDECVMLFWEMIQQVKSLKAGLGLSALMTWWGQAE